MGDGIACVPRLEYKYSKLVMDAAARETNATLPDSCAITEGEDAEDELFTNKMSLFGKLKALMSKVRGGVGWRDGNNLEKPPDKPWWGWDLRMVRASIPHPGWLRVSVSPLHVGLCASVPHPRGLRASVSPPQEGSGPQFPHPTEDAG